MRSLGAYVGVAAAAALAGVCLAGGPLYVSSAASEAVQVGLARTCLTDAGLIVRLGRSPGGGRGDADRGRGSNGRSRAAGDRDRDVRAGRRDAGRDAPQQPGRTLPIRSVLLDRTGQYDVLGVPPLAAGEALSPDWAEPIWAGPVGRRRVHLDGRTPYSCSPIRDEYPGIPVNPEPSYWCGLRTLLRPSTFGDPPPPMLLVDPATFRSVPNAEPLADRRRFVPIRRG